MTGMRSREFSGAHDNRIAGEETGPQQGLPVLLLHGGGQTRHAWRKTAARLGRDGFLAISVDQRGHGESAWDSGGRYQCADFAADLSGVIHQVEDEAGRKPVVVGASLGGIAAMMAAGEPDRCQPAGIVLVDITPRVDSGGVDRITGFMQAHAADGFASVEEAAHAVAAYLPERSRPRSSSGLLKNLRRTREGRYLWHWDPRFLSGPGSVDTMADAVQRQLEDAVRQVDVPLMLVRGSRSELVKDEHVAAFLKLAPHAKVADVRDAGHMVAGDRNDVFAEAVLGFLQQNFMQSSGC